MSQGYFLIALGQRYIDECCLLANTIRKSGDQRPISLLIHGEDKVYAREKGIFDQLIEFDSFLHWLKPFRQEQGLQHISKCLCLGSIKDACPHNPTFLCCPWD